MSTDPHADWDESERAALAGLERQLDTIRLRHRGDPPVDVLYAARHDVLPGEWQARVDAHLSASAWSRTLVEGLAAEPARGAPSDAELDADTGARLFERVMRQTRGAAAAPPRRWPQALPLWIGTAAAAILIAIGVQTTRETAPAPSSVAQRDAGAAPEPTRGLKSADRDATARDTTAGDTTARDATARDAPPDTPLAQAAPFVLPFGKPEVRLSAGALVWRGESASASSDDVQRYLADLKPALDAYRNGDYVRADAALTALRQRYPAAIEVLFYQGASRLLRDDPKGALEPLGEAARHPDQAFAADLALLLAAAEQRTGQTEAARARLRSGCAPARAQSARLCAALAALDAAEPAPAAK